MRLVADRKAVERGSHEVSRNQSARFGSAVIQMTGEAQPRIR
ncbi:hypothetical protein trd_A0052 (plasmid) [Thermomicrobium roseum DSM 5159]|uniref:Uncharacterized protein n=1 Tax=Thermomicrobium roseum (strain ATCC 27502 / DSM 5159 / P-2) TaxID=309801 RepID=B9L5C5_THERP|nr:hypothetical protein trd_A0052 [Thermomicrobium roseum DSM 5159]